MENNAKLPISTQKCYNCLQIRFRLVAELALLPQSRVFLVEIQ